MDVALGVLVYSRLLQSTCFGKTYMSGRPEPRRLTRPVSAPRPRPTISMISVVMESWRARFIRRRRVLIRSSALSVAAFMALC